MLETFLPVPFTLRCVMKHDLLRANGLSQGGIERTAGQGNPSRSVHPEFVEGRANGWLTYQKTFTLKSLNGWKTVRAEAGMFHADSKYERENQPSFNPFNDRTTLTCLLRQDFVAQTMSAHPEERVLRASRRKGERDWELMLRDFLYLIVSIIMLSGTIASAEYSSFWQSFFQQPVVTEQPKNQASIMLAPVGNSSLPGKKIKNNFEYTLSHQCIKALSQEIATQFPSLRIHISHTANQQQDPLQLATMSNCLQVNLLVMIQFYYEQDTKPHVYLWRCSYGQEFMSRRWDLSWCPVDQTYLINKTKSHLWATEIAHRLQDEAYKPWFSVDGPYKVPLKPLLGVIAPAVLIEIGLKDDAEWTNYVTPLVTSLQSILKEITTESDEDLP